ncbi:MAG: hypothetical protein SCARUB_00821 [Candidatus Scalindua rubra]|uniref:Uncharacterized protein n=1 Tax=Candidatus Scalindua rubra TaxID=1872076 RepID=A0A1E3XEL9_9BACT|nr:MAG: hypothetical protein SCARUB_00821 [Candidatus Scalindua rubra]
MQSNVWKHNSPVSAHNLSYLASDILILVYTSKRFTYIYIRERDGH